MEVGRGLGRETPTTKRRPQKKTVFSRFSVIPPHPLLVCSLPWLLCTAAEYRLPLVPVPRSRCCLGAPNTCWCRAEVLALPTRADNSRIYRPCRRAVVGKATTRSVHRSDLSLSSDYHQRMSLTCAKRLRKEMHKLQSSPPDEDIRLCADEDDFRQWKAHIRGPPDTPFAEGVYELKITVGLHYPMVPPTMMFVTKIFHPNIHFNTGEICLNILKKEWSPAWSLQGACRAILALLAHPEADSPLNCDAGNMVRAGDMRAFRSVACLYKEELASKEWPPSCYTGSSW